MTIGKTVIAIFGNLPDADALNAQPVFKMALRTNLHIHLPPNFGSIASVADAIAKAQAEEIAVLGASNYYDHTIYAEFGRAAVQARIAPVFGIEILTMNDELRAAGILINDPQNPGKGYLCGKGLTCFDQISPAAFVLWNKIREGDKQRMVDMLAKVNQIELLPRHRIQLHYDAIAQAIATEKQTPAATVFLQERHIAQALQQAIFTTIPADGRAAFLQQLYQVKTPVETQNIVAMQEAIRSYLLKQGRGAFVDEQFVNPAEAIELILGLGGYVSRPILIDGAPQILPGEGTPAELTANTLAQQIGAVEFIPNRNDLKVLTEYVRTLRAEAIVVGAGTEHNTAIWIPLLPDCRKTPLSAELTEIFWEGACVAIAHQYLCAKGKAGFRFLPERAAREEQLQAMARLGAQVIAFLRSSAKI